MITLSVGLTKSARIHKNANKTRAAVVNSDARSQLHAPTDASAPGHAFPRRGRCSSGAGGNTLNSITQTHWTKKTRYTLNARKHVVACSVNSMRANPRLTPPFPCTARAPEVWMGRTCKRSRDGILCCQCAYKQDQG